MVSVDRQQHALEVLKCINKAITNLRLYPEQSVQVSNTVEKAYSELKVFLRLYGTLNFGFHKGVPTLDGVIFERKGREQLDDLSLVDFLDKAGLTGMTLAQGLDRKRFKQVLSFFTTHHEQIQKSGGIAAFVKDTGLGAVFLEDSDSDVVQEQIVTHSFSDYLQQIMVLGVRQDQFRSLLRQGEEKPQNEDIQHEFMLLAGLAAEGLIVLLGGYSRGWTVLAGVACYDLLFKACSLGISWIFVREQPELLWISAVFVAIGYLGALLGLPAGSRFVKELRHAGIVHE